MHAHSLLPSPATALFCLILTVLLPSLLPQAHAAPGLNAHSRAFHPVKRFSLNVTERIIAADGNPINSVLLNNSLPGPEIRVRVGDRVLINVTNALPDMNTTLHIHGMSQRMTPYSDGTPLISQWPIAPGNWFEYELVIGVEDQGTYYYHTHVDLQTMTAYGPFIVEPKSEPAQYRHLKEERILQLGDWYWQNSSSIYTGLLGNPFKWPGSSKAIILNGQGLNACNQTIAQASGLDCANTSSTPSVISVSYSTDLRFRMIGSQTLSYTSFGLLNHSRPNATGDFTIIAADGTYLEPIANQSHIELLPGQRYDLIFKSKSAQAVAQDGDGCYWLRMESRWRSPAAGGWALLAYPACNATALSSFIAAGPPLPAGTSNANATLLPPAQFGWIASQFAPLKWSGARLTYGVPKDSEVKRRILIQAQQVQWFGPNTTVGNGSRWENNGNVFNDTNGIKTPLLVSLYTNSTTEPSYDRAMQGTPKGYDNVTNTYIAKSGEVFDIVIINNGSATGHNVETHPWHGHNFKQWTIASGMGNFSEEALAEARSSGFKNPIARDTHTVWPGPGASSLNQTIPTNSSGGWTVIRYRVAADGSDAGAWLLHCHFLFHQVMGMSLALVFDAPDIAAATRFDDDPNYLTYGHNVTSRWTLEHERKHHW